MQELKSLQKLKNSESKNANLKMLEMKKNMTIIKYDNIDMKSRVQQIQTY